MHQILVHDLLKGVGDWLVMVYSVIMSMSMSMSMSVSMSVSREHEREQ
jgi:hypothetical protein